MTAPTLVAVYGNPAPSATQITTGVNATTPLSCTASWATGDVLYVAVVREAGDVAAGTPTATGLTFTAMASLVTNVNGVGIALWTATAASPGTGVTVSSAVSGNSVHWDMTVFDFSGVASTGTPVTRVNNTASTDTNGPTVALTTTGANSAIVYVAGDWAAISQTTPTYSTATAGTYTTEHNIFVTGAYSSYSGVYQDAGAAGAKTVGLTSGTNMRLSTYAFEVVGSAAGSTTKELQPYLRNRARFRASTW